MRLLLYAMQSSGATTVALTLAQKPHCIAYVDIWNNFAAPELDTNLDVIAKVVATTAYPLETHKNRFKPDITALILRHPVLNFESLAPKSYANEGGMINEKFRVLEQCLRTANQFDVVFHYEDAVFAPATVVETFGRAGWELGYEAILHARTAQDIHDANLAALPIMAGRLKYGPGGHRGEGMERTPIAFPQAAGRTAHMPRMCPALFERYDRLIGARGAAWHVPQGRALLTCNLIEMLCACLGPGPIPAHTAESGYTVDLRNAGTGCTVAADGISLSPAPIGGETSLHIAGLPAYPFNRMSGIACSKHPCGAATRATLRIETQGATLATQTVNLSHAAMAAFELNFLPQNAATIALAITVAPCGDRTASADDAVLFRQIRLDHITR